MVRPTLSSSSVLFAGSCDDDGYERSHEVKAVAADGSETYLTNGYGGESNWCIRLRAEPCTRPVRE